ncbi:ABC transporter permease [Thiococcus pfennigii]|uniref:ABC transporter permease n=1 Tax=Thiococcus pfennigii TaxID=1057 RepID=UPI001907A2AF|nr:ABC transporter permease [Thiococcus pfennigii]MBK1701421.1 ABC transporter permease [Thiococcus pfennigii]
MRALSRKALRDLARLKGQVGAIAVVIAAGVMVLILTVAMREAIASAQARFYETQRFADVFAELERAPERVAARLREIPGIDQIETRVQAPVRLEVPGFAGPVRGLLLSLPDGRQPALNRLHLREGALPAPGRADQVVLSEPFAEAHGLRPGDALRAIVNGREVDLVVSGLALSPEFIYQVAPTDLLPDYAHYGVLWMGRPGLAEAMDMDGAFNSLVLTLAPGADPRAVIAAVDRRLARYGGIGATDRDEQISHRFLADELDQLRVMALVLPAVFLGVAAFLLNLLMARIVTGQRQQIAILKAFGYGDGAIAGHFGLMAGLVVVLGLALGIALGAWAASGLVGLYAEYFRFPQMGLRLPPQSLALALALAVAAALLGTLGAVRRAARQPPAEAMRPPAPERFRPSWLDRSPLGRYLGQPTRIIVRNLSRHRAKTLFSTVGIALSGGLLLLGSYQFGAVDRLLDVQYRLVMQMDLHLTLTEPTSFGALAELRAQPGVRHVEGYRSAAVRLVAGRRDYRTAILGVEAAPRLRRLLDGEHRPVPVPPDGLLLTRYLADYLGVRPGGSVTVEVLEGHRRTLAVGVAGVVDEPIGLGAYMARPALNRLMGEGPAVSGAWLLVDPAAQERLLARLWEMPRIAGIALVADAERQFRDYIGDTVLATMTILLLMAGSITFAVVYNNARIAFAERARELATLRVLGLTRAEVSWILIGEIAVLTLLAIPLGWLVGTGFAALLSWAMTTDLFRMPWIITPRTYAFSAAGVLVAAALSVTAIARRLGRLDMVLALKTLD